MIRLYEVESNKLLGQITDEQLAFLIEHLEETSTGDQDYYLDEATIELIGDAGADPALLGTLRSGLAGKPGYDLRWERV